MYVSCVWGMDWIRPHNPLLPQPEFTNSWWSFQLKIHCPMKNVSLTKDCTKTHWHNLYDTILLRFFYVVFPSLLSVPLWCSLRFFFLDPLVSFFSSPWVILVFSKFTNWRFTTPSLLLWSEPSPSKYRHLDVPQTQYLKPNMSSTKRVIYSTSQPKLVTLSIFPILDISTTRNQSLKPEILQYS